MFEKQRDRRFHRQNLQAMRYLVLLIVSLSIIGFSLCCFGKRSYDGAEKSSSSTTFTARSRPRDNARVLREAVGVSHKTSKMTTRVDCSTVKRYCTNDDDCASMCLNFRRVAFVCDEHQHLCSPRFVDARTRNDGDEGRKSDGGDDDDDDDDDDGESDRACDTKNGEFALLVGYTELGSARWQCVNMYRHFAQRDKFCEGGSFEMNALIREPSFRDCSCPPSTVRAIYSMSNLYDIGLPHCIPSEKWILYKDNMQAV